MTQYCCTRCGKPIFREVDVLRRTKLWDLGEYDSEVFVIRQAIDEGSLQRYDVSLHQGWYCCRFIMMRMLVDKFGTGRDRLVYADSVAPVPAGQKAPISLKDTGQIRITSRDFDAVVSREQDELSVVKFGALWCPPCRLVDQAIERITRAGGIEGVRFFEVDVDEQPELGQRFASRSIPVLAFYYRGQRIELVGDVPNLDGGVWVGGIRTGTLRGLCRAVLAGARRGMVQVDPFALSASSEPRSSTM